MQYYWRCSILNQNYKSWGAYPQTTHEVSQILWRDDLLPISTDETTVLPYGNGRSYGDCCLNDGGRLLDTSRLDHFISIDLEQGILRCEAGVTFDTILELIVPHGWFLPVTPGTRYITVGGAVANDVHGKNHHKVGSFGCHISQLELLRSNGQRVLCSRTEKTEWFSATIGGLGLTGLIVWVEFQLKRIHSPLMAAEILPFSDLSEFCELCDASDHGWEYTVAWVDSLAKGRKLGRGVFIRGNHIQKGGLNQHSHRRTIIIPFNFPRWVLNQYTVRLFNWLFYRRQLLGNHKKTVHYAPFFYPLDGIRHWNRLYGKQGFFQYQCVVPIEGGQEVIAKILKLSAHSGQGSFLSVLKLFGSVPSPGMLSFPRKGITLALDYANRGDKTLQLLNKFDEIVRSVGGVVYPAKDARMSSQSYQCYYPQWKKFSKYIDPRFSSSFWRRVTSNVQL